MVITAFAQNTKSTIKGFVTDKDNGEPIISALVKIENSKIVTQTDVNGFFNLPKLEPGTYTLVISFNNYDDNSFVVDVDTGQILSKKNRVNEKEE